MREIIHDFVTKNLNGFALVEDGIDRHGSVEWTMHAQDGELHRYVIVALSSSSDGGYLIEIWAGVSDGLHFTRRLVRSQPAGMWLDSLDALGHLMHDPIKHAKALAETLGKSDLEGTYVVA